MTPHPFLPALAATGTGIFVGSTIVATRYVVHEIEPASLAFLRYLIAFVCLAPLVILADWVKIAAKDWFPICLLGVGQFGILVILFNFGMQFIPSARGAMLFAIFPLLTLLIASAIGQEKLTRTKTLGVFLCISGVGAALSESLFGGGLSGFLLGELAVLGSALTGALCNVFYRPYLNRYPSLIVSVISMVAAVVFLLVPAAWEGLWDKLPQISLGGWGAVLYIGFGSAAGFWLLIWALKHSTATKISVFLSLSPLVATGLGFLFLDEAVTLPFLIGLTLVITGLVVSQRAEA